jgi:site-specific DNA recombinase
MSPAWARKGSKRWRYYVSQAALQGDKSKAGSILRVPAADVEALVTDAIANRPMRCSQASSMTTAATG